MSRMTQIQAAERAKQKLCTRFEKEPWCGGVGIAPRPGGGFALRLNVHDVPADVELPERFEDHDVEIVRIAGYRPRGKRTQRPPSSPKSPDDPSDQRFLIDLGHEMEEEAAGWRTDDREWSRLTIRRRREPDFNAIVWRFRNGRNRVEIYDGVAVSLRHHFDRLLASDGFLRVAWERRTPAGPRPQKEDLQPWVHARDRPWLRDYLAKTATRFVMHHEIAHVLRGHLYYDASTFGDGSGPFSYSEVSAGFDAPRKRAVWKAFEIDADRVGADIFARTTALSHWQQADRNTRRQFMTICLFAIGFSFLLLERAQRARTGRASTVHLQPFLRFLVVIDVLGAGFRRELKLGERSMMRGAFAAVSYIRAGARVLRYNTRTWAKTDSRAWTRALTQRDAALERYESTMDALLDGRSTLFPHGAVGGAER